MKVVSISQWTSVITLNLYSCEIIRILVYFLYLGLESWQKSGLSFEFLVWVLKGGYESEARKQIVIYIIYTQKIWTLCKIKIILLPPIHSPPEKW